ncbi:ubiquinol-cytochrome c reductase core subunit 1 [Coemansia biformis]|uniref:Cytochrome b-c1 complex subunit 2, mitochondrial n=1 Tax=Coemansia biformis TaxID=1286918 RepID=A0A9W7YA15_9FUNG|nr:ubiquinol-cytochrome c reductase core subunit 1 [Coemansia biformis]
MLQSKVAARVVGPLATRGYASVASSAPVVSTANGIKIAAVDGAPDSPLASISLVIKAGSRFETAETAGAAHYLKAFGFRNTQDRTSFRTIREAELNGATLTAEATRENITYRVQCFKEAVPYFVQVLAEVATATKFAEHEFRDVAKVVALESLSARSDPATLALGGVHQAAFRSGLGNSLYAPAASPVATGDAVRQYAQGALTGGRVAVVATGVDADTLAKLVGESGLAELPGAAAAETAGMAAAFTGGAQQVYESASPVAHYALAFGCEPRSAHALGSLLGTQRRLKWSGGVSALSRLAAAEGFRTEAFSFAYSDAGLVGVLVSAPSAQIKGAVEKVAATIQKDVAGAAPDAIQRAAAATAVDVADVLATQKGQLRALGAIALGQSAAALEAVDAAALASAAKTVFKSKPVAAAVGLSQTTAYVDTLGF